MKNLLLIGSLLLMLFSCTSRQPNDSSLLFSVKFKPESNYTVETQRSSETAISYNGAAKALNKLKSMGVKNPNTISKTTSTEAVLTTGKLLDKTYIPVKLEIIRSSTSDGRQDIPQGVVINGESKNGCAPEFSSVQSGKSNAADEKVLLQLVQNSFAQLNFPEKRLKIGEQFTMESTLTIPMEKSHVEIAVSTIYKLVSVTSGLAAFDISQEYRMNQLRMDNSFNGSGGGQGKLTYNIAKNMVSSLDLNSGLEMNKKLENFVFVLKTQSKFVQKIEVSQN